MLWAFAIACTPPLLLPREGTGASRWALELGRDAASLKSPRAHGRCWVSQFIMLVYALPLFFQLNAVSLQWIRSRSTWRSFSFSEFSQRGFYLPLNPAISVRT